MPGQRRMDLLRASSFRVSLGQQWFNLGSDVVVRLPLNFKHSLGLIICVTLIRTPLKVLDN